MTWFMSRPSSCLFPFILAASSLLFPGCGRSDTAAASPAPAAAPTVAVVSVTPETVKVSTQWIATLDGLVNAQIRPQVSGYLVKATYRDGSAIGKGDVLFEIDPRPSKRRSRSPKPSSRRRAPSSDAPNRMCSATSRSPPNARSPKASWTTTSRPTLAAQSRGETWPKRWSTRHG